MAPISARTAVLAKWATIPAALIVGGIVVSQASYSAFSDTTTAENNWTAGTVQLGDIPATAALSVADLAPGHGGVKCITVSSSGSIASAVKLYATSYTSPAGSNGNHLGSYIRLVIAEGTGANANCSDFQPIGVATFDNTLEAFGNITSTLGIGTWKPAAATVTAPETRTYKIQYSLPYETTPNDLQGATAKVTFNWEAQNLPAPTP